MAKLTKKELLSILSARFEGGEKRLSDIPSPSLLYNGEKTALRLAKAIKNQEKIVVVGDYDVDGVVSTAIVVEFFRLLNYPLKAYIPNRFSDGYGVSPTLLERIDADVIITVDNGITAVEAANICRKRGIDLLITDHHTPLSSLPDAYSIVDPKLPECQYPFKDICGAEVIWLVLALLKKELHSSINMRSFVDLLSLAIIADIMPLVDINRVLVKDGLQALMHSSRPASVIIRDFLHKPKIISEDIAFMIAPRLNSAGRLEDATLALKFLTATTLEEAYEAFEILNKLNQERKTIELQATQEAIALLQECHDDVLVVAKEQWHEGVVGIVASRLCEHFAKPAIVLSINDEEAKGSARSVGGVDIFRLIKENETLLKKFGGHKAAAGLSLKKDDIEEFRLALNESAKDVAPEAFVVDDHFLGELDPKEIDFELVELLEQFEPYGYGNERPKFLAKDVVVVHVEHFGVQKNHTKMVVAFEKEVLHIPFIVYRNNSIEEGMCLSFSYTITKHSYLDKEYLQLIVNKIYT